ncbi:helix-turn-helix domain-containing protein [Enterococcus sp.]|uniref:winged helix-turn-helix domain-containing protein n=1 Tax=Enterococcus sp. TaxID=35783 RepID=UPI00290A8987|nr:helix-turn-helix domain-containing protein [Enterococcus sp.]MDU5333435.1 helix-turn-helix domain-containing protein [Enterococcus sp.]
MVRVLFITKYIDRERKLEDNFRQLGYEVFVSDQFLNLSIKQPHTVSLTEHFKIVVFSETLTNKEVEFLLRNLKDYSLAVFRKVEKEPSDEERQSWSEKGINEWIITDILIEELREMLVEFDDPSKNNLSFSENAIEKRSLSSLALNSTQLRFLQILCREHERIITREKMCELLWNRPSTPSNLSQLSCLVKLLREKLSDQGIEGESIITVWGQGYQLSENFYRQVTNELKVLN